MTAEPYLASRRAGSLMSPEQLRGGIACWLMPPREQDAMSSRGTWSL